MDGLSLDQIADITLDQMQTMSDQRLLGLIDVIDYHLSRPDDYLTDALHMKLFNKLQEMKSEKGRRNLD